VTVAGIYAYVADGDSGLRIIDISNPTAPIEVGSYTAPGPVYDVTVTRNYAFVAEGSNGLRIIDVSNPNLPFEVSFYDFPGGAEKVFLKGTYVYVGPDYYGTTHIIDISNPAVPIEAGNFYPGGSPGWTVVGNSVYTANYFGGLFIMRLLTDKVTGSIPITGGNLGSTDGNTNLIFPSGAFTQTVNLTYRQLLYDENVGGLVGIGHIFDISAVYSDTGETASLAPGQTFTVTVQYSDTEMGPALEDTLALYSWDGTTWIREATSTLDLVNNLITATPNHLSLWAVLGETRHIYIPVVGR
jgi:hypothetical protein